MIWHICKRLKMGLTLLSALVFVLVVTFASPAISAQPILLVSSSSNPFSGYYAEILRTEGFNEFDVIDVSSLSSSMLAPYDIVILGEMSLTSSQVSTLSDWVNGGGELIAMRPDKKLAGLLGLTDLSSTLSNAYLLVNTASGPGAGIVNQTIQFHGSADSYSLNGASVVATLYSSSTKATASPAVTLNSVGVNGGQAAAFTYDLARSVVYTRQGNPAWAGEERDGSPPIRPDDMFYGSASFDPQSDWVNLNKVAIPQADEQQRLLANLIIRMNAAKKPLPRFWYFPRNLTAVVIMTGDDHGALYGGGATAARFNQFLADSPRGCVVDNWECVRGTTYLISPNVASNPLSNSQAASYASQGFEISVHVDSDPDCSDWTFDSLDSSYTSDLNSFVSKYTSVPAPVTHRMHCVSWSDFDSQPKVELSHGIRMDTTYYYWPGSWINDTPGFFTGSGMPMRFTDINGNILDIYQAATQMTDESDQTYPYTINTLLDNAVGSSGYYGAFVVNAHNDEAASSVSDAVVNSALARGVPVITAQQMLTWLDGRNGSSFGSVLWSSNILSFSVSVANGANGLVAMVPLLNGQTLVGITRDGSPVPYTTATMKGIQYARFTAANGAYQVSYASDGAPPSVNTVSPANGASGVATGSNVTATFSEAMDPASINSGTFQLRDPANNLVSAAVTYNAAALSATLDPAAALSNSTIYATTIIGGANGVKDVAGNPMTNDVTWSFTTAAQSTGPFTIWPATTVPGTVDTGPDSAVELGVKFRSDTSGYVTGIRFYKASTNTGTHVGNLWTSGGTRLATATFSNETASGWQQVNFSSPVAITANTVYVASYHTNVGHYSDTLNYFATSGVDNAPLHALANGSSGFNGVYAYGSTSSFPNQGYLSSNYWVDVVFSPAAPVTLQSIAVTPANPTIQTGATQQFTATGTYSDGSTQNLTTQVTWTSSNTAVATINTAGLATAVSAGTSTITATLGGVSGSTTLTAQTAALTVTTTSLPGATLNVSYSATLAASGGTPPYTWSVASGSLPAGLLLNSSSGVISGTPTSAGTFNFTVQATDSSSPVQTSSKALGITVSSQENYSIWPATAVPGVADAGPDSAVELGVKFRSDTSGYVKGIRFYKASTNTGTHVGNLWTSGGTRLATATFSNETASGWQQVNFSSPVAITANTVYVASYHTNVGHYSDNLNYFATSGVDNAPLHALANGVSGYNGVFVYGSSSRFPNQGYNSSNYWVDVAFSPATPVTLQSIVVTPANPTIQTGATQQFTATGTYSDGSTQNLTAQVTWTSSNTSVATISAAGLATGIAAGTSNMSATLGTVNGGTALTVQSAQVTLSSISVTPANPTINVGATQQFTATGTYSDGSTQNITSQVTWSSSNTSVATITTAGLATGAAVGTSTISTTLSGITGSTILTVQVPGLAITTASLPAGIPNVSYSASLAASGGTTPYTWSISNGSLPAGMSLNSGTGVISGTPTAIGVSNFTLQVTDSAGSPQTATKALSITVAAATLASITVTPVNPAIPAGTTQQFTATGTYSDNTTQNITGQVTWTSSNTGVATITASGLTTGAAAGTSTISATLSGITGSTVLTVQTATLTSIAVTPANPTISTGSTQQFTATGTYSDNTTQNITGQVTWASSNTGVATITAAGLATGVAAGTSTVSATSGSVTGSTVLTVQAAALAITTTSLPAGIANVSYSTTLAASGGTPPYTWSISSGSLPAGLSLNSGSGVISGTPTAIGVSDFTLQVTDSAGSPQTATKALSITVAAATLTSITVTPVNPAIPAGTTQQFTATGTYSDNTTQNITGQVTWTSSNTGVATITAAGLATGVAVGTSTISATLSGVTGSTTLTVQAPTLTSIAVTPANPTISTGTTRQFTATGTYSNGSTQNLTAQVTWASSNTNVATISAAGLATGIAAGTSNISATLGTVTGGTTLTVQPLPLTITTTSLPTARTGVPYSRTLAASGGTPPYSWSITSGSLPPGLSLGAATGLISGTPTSTGSYSFTVRATDSGSPAQSATRTLSIRIRR